MYAGWFCADTPVLVESKSVETSHRVVTTFSQGRTLLYFEGLSKANMVCTHNDNFPLQMQRLSYIRPANTSSQGISSVVIYVFLKEKG